MRQTKPKIASPLGRLLSLTLAPLCAYVDQGLQHQRPAPRQIRGNEPTGRSQRVWGSCKVLGLTCLMRKNEPNAKVNSLCKNIPRLAYSPTPRFEV